MVHQTELPASVSMDVLLAEESFCVSEASLKTHKATVQNEIEVLRAENFKPTKQVDRIS